MNEDNKKENIREEIDRAMDAIKAALEKMDLGRLESMKNVGVK